VAAAGAAAAVENRRPLQVNHRTYRLAHFRLLDESSAPNPPIGDSATRLPDILAFLQSANRAALH